jgi:uncharacterized OB-fold protein
VSGGPGSTVGPDAIYRERLRAGRIEMQACERCRRVCFPPRTHCPSCGAQPLAWRAILGTGTVYATTVVRQRPDHGPDYNVALIDVTEGARMMSRVEGVPPTEVRIGMAVRAKITLADGEPLVVFVPA